MLIIYSVIVICRWYKHIIIRKIISFYVFTNKVTCGALEYPRPFLNPCLRRRYTSACRCEFGEKSSEFFVDTLFVVFLRLVRSVRRLRTARGRVFSRHGFVPERPRVSSLAAAEKLVVVDGGSTRGAAVAPLRRCPTNADPPGRPVTRSPVHGHRSSPRLDRRPRRTVTVVQRPR